MDIVQCSSFVEGFHDQEQWSKMEFRMLKGIGAEAGAQVSILGMGASAFGGVFENVNQQRVNEVVQLGLKGGINIIDTAHWYGHGKSETRLGIALRDVPRRAYYMLTKCGRYESDVDKMFDFTAERTSRAVDESLTRLGCEYLDCMQVHDPEYAPSLDIILEQTLPALQKAKDQGKIRAIGITGYPLEVQKQIIMRSKVKIDTSLVYCHYCLNDTSLLNENGFLDFLDEKNIGCINASPLCMGLLSEGGPAAWHPAPDVVKSTCAKAVLHCKTHGVNISRLANDFVMRQERIPTTLTSTSFPEQMKENLQAAYDYGKLNEKEQNVLEEIQKRFFHPMGNITWEGVEVSKYHHLMEKIEQGHTDVGTLSTNKSSDN